MQSTCIRAVARLAFGAAVLVVAVGQAHAVNKCTLPSGDVVYQDAPCPSAASKAQPVKTWSNTPGDSSGGDGWKFQRESDAMTGKVYCRAVSDQVTGRYDGSRFTNVNLAVIATAGSDSLVVWSDGDSFHNNLHGMGLKIDSGAFVPIDQAVAQRIVSLSNPGEDATIAALASGKSVRLRVRFWPYDKLYDTNPISTDGYRQALTEARRCAGRQ